jgi:hypothetical protein
MVEILCPHCEGDIEVNDDASGVFECPLCNGEFEWNVEEDESLMTAQEAHQKMVGSVIQSNNPHGLYKMHPVEKVAEGAFLGVATVVSGILVVIVGIVVIFFVILVLIFLLAGSSMNGSFFA